MDPDKLELKRKFEEKEDQSPDSKQQKPEKKSGIWIINKDLKTCIKVNAPIVTYAGHTDYRFHPLSEGLSNNPFSLSMENEQTTVLLAKCNGLMFGRFINVAMPSAPLQPKAPKRTGKSKEAYENSARYLDYKERSKYYLNVQLPLYNKQMGTVAKYTHDCGDPGSHAEDAFISAWRAAEQAGVIDELRKIHGLQAFVTLKISRSPCSKCTQKLIKFVELTKDVKLRIKVQTLYEGEGGKVGASNVHELLAKGIPVREWNVPLYAAKHREKSQTKSMQLHELYAWGCDGDDETHKLLLQQAEHKLGRFYHHVGKKPEELASDYKKASRNSGKQV
jgi:Secreted Novel AID/APOBEC-like Deaminase 4